MLRTDKSALMLVLAVLLVPLTVCLPLTLALTSDGPLSVPLCLGTFGLAIFGGTHLMRAVINRVEERVSQRQDRKRKP